jgi:hypothetical protein
VGEKNEVGREREREKRREIVRKEQSKMIV